MPKGGLICPDCMKKLSPIRQPACKKCGKEVSSQQAEYCPECMRRPKSFASGVSLLQYNEAARCSMAAIKYKNRREYLDFYSRALAYRYGWWLAFIGADALIPVPVHPARRRTRGFNQAEELAVRISRLSGIPVCSDCLVRTRKTVAQKNLNAAQRLKNLQSAFGISVYYRTHPEKIPKTAVLIDDIYTTGSTAESCTRILLAAGAERVHVLTICIVQ